MHFQLQQLLQPQSITLLVAGSAHRFGETDAGREHHGAPSGLAWSAAPVIATPGGGGAGVVVAALPDERLQLQLRRALLHPSLPACLPAGRAATVDADRTCASRPVPVPAWWCRSPACRAVRCRWFLKERVEARTEIRWYVERLVGCAGGG